MAQTARKQFVEPDSKAHADSPSFAPPAANASSGAQPADGDGPAQALQAYLRDALEDESVERRWSPGQTLRFIAVGSGLLWAVLLGGLAILS